MEQVDLESAVVFYDGECGLCDRTVQLLLRMDRRSKLRFATLQGETATAQLGAPEGPAEAWSIKLAMNGQIYQMSSAVIRALAHTGGIWSAFIVFLAVPRFIRDGVYRFVAAHRYKWFGNTNSCLLPTPAMRERFLP